MSRSLNTRLRLHVTDAPRRRGSAPTLRGRASSDVVTRRALVVGGVALAAIMLILSAQSTRARSAPELSAEPATAGIVETAQL
jgi:hypothetical protein